MVRQWQEMFYDERYSEVYLSPDLPDYVKWAEAMGCVGIRVESPEEVQPAIDKANSIDDRPVVVEFRVDAREKVFPMVPAGHAQRRHRPARRSQMPEGAAAMSDRRSCNHHILSVLVENRPGVLARVGGLFARRGYNIFSLAVAPTEDERFSRITIVVDVESAPLEQIVKQLFKLIERGARSASSTRAARSSASCCSPPCAADGRDARPGRRAGADLRGQDPRRRRRRDHRVSSKGTPTSSTTSRSCCAGYGIVELQRTGRVALPKLEREAARVPRR